MGETTDVVVVGAGLAGLVAACELLDRGRRVTILDQEPRASLGGQAFWSLGGLFMVDTPEQRRMRIRDSADLALSDWLGSAGFDRAEDAWPRRWAEAYLAFASGEMRAWLHGLGMRWFPVVGWAERGGGLADGHGNSVPRFHVTWGTGPGVLAPFVARVRAAEAEGRLRLRFRHRVTALCGGPEGITGVEGEILAEDAAGRGMESTRAVAGRFEIAAGAVIVASGGIGGNAALVRQNWPVERLGPPPESMVCGVPAHVDGLMIGHAERAGARVINNDRMWHYTEGIRNWDPIWPNHGIRILPGPSSMWFDADGNRLPAPCLPGFDSLGTLAHLCRSGQPHSWFVTPRRSRRRNSRSRGPSRTPTSPARTSRFCCAAGSAGPRRRHSRRSSAMARISSLPAGLRNWWRG